MIPARGAIRHLRVPAPLAAPARRSVEHWLDTLDLPRWGLPPQALVAVRRAQAPLRALSGRGANDPLAAALRSAVRPAHVDFVGAAVDAVWFADEVELLACLARDAVAGHLAARWWWATLLGATPDAAAALRRWEASARVVPAALAALAASGSDRAWIASLEAAGRARLVQALALAFPVAAAVPAAIADCEAARDKSDAPAAVIAGAAGPGPAALASAAPAPWLPAALADATTALLRLAQVLQLQPQRAADEAFAARLVRAADDMHLPPAARGAQAPWAGASRQRAVPSPRSGPAATPEPPLHGTTPKAVAPGAPQATAPGPIPGDEAASSGPVGVAAEATPSTAAHAVVPAPQRAAPAARPLPVDSFDTAYGGLFFVLNAALALGLYGDFTQPLHCGLALTPWQFLHAAAKAWVGRRFAADPLAGWLGERLPAPVALPLPDRWHAERDWLQPFAADARPWHALVEPGALRLLHPAGFTIARHAGATAADLPALLAAVGVAVPALRVHRPARAGHAPRGLLDLLRPVLGARLALALGLPPRHAVRLLCDLPARLQLSAGRLDLHFAFGALPLAVRLSGLDRDPGWIPAAGCDFRFHFD